MKKRLDLADKETFQYSYVAECLHLEDYVRNNIWTVDDQKRTIKERALVATIKYYLSQNYWLPEIAYRLIQWSMYDKLPIRLQLALLPVIIRFNRKEHSRILPKYIP